MYKQNLQMSINAKRDKFRDQIRKKQREAFFLQQRNKNLSAPNENMHKQQHLIQQLLQNHHVQANLTAILSIVRTTHYQAGTMKLIQKGLIPTLISFLKDFVQTRKTLQILSFLTQNFTQKQKQHSFDLCAQLYQFGIFQYLVKLLDLKQGGVLSTFILYCFSLAHQDYCQAIFQGGVYKILIRELKTVLENSPYIQVDSKAEEYVFCMHIFKILENIASFKSSFDYTQQKSQITQLLGFCLERKLFLKITFGVFYEILMAQQRSFTEDLVVLINPILSQTEADSNYLVNMMATIFRLSPHPLIDYSLVFKIAVKNSKTYKILSLIFEELIKNQLQKLIPTSEIFWQKILTGSLNNEETFKKFLRATSKIDLQFAFFCRIIAVALQEQTSSGIKREGLETLESFVKDQRRLDVKLNEINKHKIPKLLNKIGLCGNIKLKERASWLQDYILGPMTDMSSRIESL